MVHFPTILVDSGVFHSPKLVNLFWQINKIPKPECFGKILGDSLTKQTTTSISGRPPNRRRCPPVTQNLGDKEMF